MPAFTIERTFDVPHLRHATYEAASLEEALRMDAENDNWDRQREDYDCSGSERVTGAWAGQQAYHGDSLLNRGGKDGAAITTRDLGLAIRDFLEGRDVNHFNDDEDAGPAERIEVIDCSDPDNLVAVTERGRKFVVRIFAEG